MFLDVGAGDTGGWAGENPVNSVLRMSALFCACLSDFSET